MVEGKSADAGAKKERERGGTEGLLNLSIIFTPVAEVAEALAGLKVGKSEGEEEELLRREETSKS